MAGIYVLSHPKHAAVWRKYKREGYPIVSTWVDDPHMQESRSKYIPNWLVVEKEIEVCSCAFIYSSCDDLPNNLLIEVGMFIGYHKLIYSLGTFRGMARMIDYPQFLYKEFPNWDIYRTLNACKDWDNTGLAEAARREQQIGQTPHTSKVQSNSTANSS
jgi:hypothetical protein